MHASIQFDVYWPTRNALFLSSMYQFIHQSERVHLWFQVPVEHGLEGRHLRVHDHDVLRDAVATQGHTLVSHSHGQIVHPMVLQGLGHLHSTSSIGISLDHAHQLGLGLQEGTVEVQVVHHGIEVHFEDGLMHLLLQPFCDAVEAKCPGSLDEHYFIVQLTERITVQEFIRRGKEEGVGQPEECRMGTDLRSNAYQRVHTTLLTQTVDLAIQLLCAPSALQDIAQQEGPLTLVVHTT